MFLYALIYLYMDANVSPSSGWVTSLRVSTPESTLNLAENFLQEISHSTAIPSTMSKTFLYFAYGSNMLSKRIHINNPTAVQKSIGKLKDHRLDFANYTNRWKGSASTIVPNKDCNVWGVVWEIDISNLPNLDDQEGVQSKIYFAKNVTIITSSGEELECRVYQQCQLPENYVKPSLLPLERQPSFIYLNTMIKGAKEFRIPDDYIQFLESFRHNGYKGEIEITGLL